MEDEFKDCRKVIRSELEAGRKISGQMSAIIDLAEREYPDGDWERFRKIPYDRIAPMRNWLTKRFAAEPPQIPVTGLWFGLCHTQHGSKSADLYLSASARYSSNDVAFRWTMDPEYQPDTRFARSDVLWKIYQRSHRNKGGLKKQAERPLCLAYSAFVIARLLSDIPPQIFLNGAERAAVAVGYEDGEGILLGELTKDEFQLSATEAGKKARKKVREKLSDRNSFWKLIAELLAATRGNLSTSEKALDRQLSERSATEIKAFTTQFCEVLNQACTSEIYDAATMIGCSSADSFLDFRRWIVFQGPHYFARILNDVEFLATLAPAGDPTEWYSEYHPHTVYRKTTGRKLPDWDVLSFPVDSTDQSSDSELAARYPKLWKRLR